MSSNPSGLPYDYSWRDYTGTIPKDAVEGGTDNKGNVYIGQVSVKNHGIIPVTIHPGETTVVAVVWGVHYVSSYIKILCSSSREKLKWLTTDTANFHIHTIGKCVVRGGVENNVINYIGRINHQGQTLVSKIHPTAPGNIKFWYPYGNKELSSNSYQVLIYDSK